MTREDLIREYKDMYEKRKSIAKELDALGDAIAELKAEYEREGRWMDAVSDRFDMLYGCRSNYPDKIPYHLHVYLDGGEEVPE